MNRRTFYMFMSPSLLVMLALMVFPLVTSIWLSTQYVTFRNINEPEFVGLANYIEVFEDQRFWSAFSFTMTYIAIANRILDAYDALWNGKHLNIVAEQYMACARFEGPSGHLSYGREPVSNMLASITAALPDGRFEPHHLIVRQQNDRAVRVAIRWTFCGTHSGHGRYGAPTNAPVAILGISHFELHDGLIASEWMVVDETAIYAQIAAYQEIRD